MLAHNRLPTASYLHHLNILHSPICTLCHTAEETLIHLLFSCPRVINIWSHVQISVPITSTSSPNYNMWLRNFLLDATTLTHQSLPLSILLSFSLWHIWKSRNINLLEKRFDQVSLMHIFKNVHEFFHLGLNQRPKILKPPMHIKWKPPNRGSFKLNTDGATSAHNNCSGIGGLIRDSMGNWKLGFSECTYKANSIHMELLALLKGLQLALSHNLLPLEVETDPIEVIHLLHNDNLVYSHLLNDCRYVLHQLGNPSIKHTYREENMVADRLAKQLFESTTPTNTTVYYAAPTFVLDLLHADMHGPPYVRRVSPT